MREDYGQVGNGHMRYAKYLLPETLPED